MSEIREITGGLQFPEGPIAMPDGSVLLVEIKRGTLTRVQPDGGREIVADLGGGPNGAAIGPDGKVYVCNSGGFEWFDVDGLTVPGDEPENYTGGMIQRVDADTGGVETLYTECGGHPLKGPNDIVFDAEGGFWFTDLGKSRKRDMDRGGLYYALPDGSEIREVVYPLFTPNGVGLSADGRRVYVAETMTARVYYWEIVGRGEVRRGAAPNGGDLLAGVPGLQWFDSLAVDSEGAVCVATILNGGVTRISANGQRIEHFPTPDPLTTNICFGGADLRTAYVTLSGTGKLVRMDWPVPGMKLNF
jgi:gluconolactonase